MSSIFGNELVNHAIGDQVILYTTNEEILKLNECILDLLPGQQRTYFSSDDIVSDDNERSQYPIEFLNSLMTSGMLPTH